MTALVDLEDVKRSLNVCFNDDDMKLDALIEAASQMVVGYLKSRAPTVLGVDVIGSSPLVVPPRVAAAVRYLVALMYRTPDGDAEDAFANGMLPAPVRAMLAFDRDPALA